MFKLIEAFYKHGRERNDSAVKEGLESGVAENFNPSEHLEALKANKRRND